MSVVCWLFLQTFQTCFCIQVNNVDPDQTAPRGAVWSGSMLQKLLKKSQADDKADDNCCDWQFKGTLKQLQNYNKWEKGQLKGRVEIIRFIILFVQWK